LKEGFIKMPSITIEWDNDKRDTIIMRYLASYTWDELDAITQEMYDMLNSVPYKVNVILVLNPRNRAPFSTDMMSRLRNILINTPKNISLFCVVGMGNSVTRALFSALLKIYPPRFPVIPLKSETEAREVLAERQGR
jgi:hypothetical protein